MLFRSVSQSRYLWSFYREAMKNVPTNQAGLPNTMLAHSASDSTVLSTKLPSFSTSAIFDWFKYVGAKFADKNVNNVGGSHSLRVAESARLLQALGYGNYTTISKLYRDNESAPTKLMLDGSEVSGISVPSTDVGVRVSIRLILTAVIFLLLRLVNCFLFFVRRLFQVMRLKSICNIFPVLCRFRLLHLLV